MLAHSHRGYILSRVSIYFEMVAFLFFWVYSTQESSNKLSRPLPFFLNNIGEFYVVQGVYSICICFYSVSACWLTYSVYNQASVRHQLSEVVESLKHRTGKMVNSVNGLCFPRVLLSCFSFVVCMCDIYVPVCVCVCNYRRHNVKVSKVILWMPIWTLIRKGLNFKYKDLNSLAIRYWSFWPCRMSWVLLLM